MSWRSGQSYSQDLRDRVIAAADGGVPVRQAAVTFGVSIAYIYKALIRRRLTGDSGPNPNRGHRRRKLTPDQELALPPHIRPRPKSEEGRVGKELGSKCRTRGSRY